MTVEASWVEKVCPVVRRVREGRLELLAFRHPLAGFQLAKGSIEPGEPLERAAERELFEESGLRGRATRRLGDVDMACWSQRWRLVLCEIDAAPDHWVHRTADGGGLDFAFFWRALEDPPGVDWHEAYRLAWAAIAPRLSGVTR